MCSTEGLLLSKENTIEVMRVKSSILRIRHSCFVEGVHISKGNFIILVRVSTSMLCIAHLCVVKGLYFSVGLATVSMLLVRAFLFLLLSVCLSGNIYLVEAKNGSAYLHEQHQKSL